MSAKEETNPKNLAETGWGIIFASDADPGIREALKDLLDHRRVQATQQHEHYYQEYSGVRAYRPGETKLRFLARQGAGPGPADPEKVPYYLLIVGSPEAIPFSFQYQLDLQYAVGRIYFDTLEEYAQYAQSIVAVESGKAIQPKRATFFGVTNPDDPATNLSVTHLLKPLAQSLAQYHSDWIIETLVGEEATKGRLDQLIGGKETPALLFTTSHGMGFPIGDPRQLRHQGALLCQEWPGPRVWGNKPIPEDFYFSADDVSEDARLLGMLAFHSASYSVGTLKFDDFLQQTLHAPAAIAPHSFTANLPRRLLSHPNGGAMAVIGNAERVWGFSSSSSVIERQRQAYTMMLDRLLDGHPIGSAFDFFNERYAELASDLSSQLEYLKFGSVSDDVELSGLWMARNDARSYIIFGDPAVKLLVSESMVSVAERPSLKTITPGSGVRRPDPISRDVALARIEFVMGDLLDLHVDVLVHPVGLDLARGGILGQQLVGRVGSELAEQLQNHQRLSPAGAIVTSADSLPARYLIHVAIEDSTARHSIESVTRGASAAMEKVESLGDVRTIAFPALGSGAAGLNPVELAPEILRAITSHLERGSQVERVIFAFINEAIYQTYVDAYRSLGGKVEVVPQPFNTYSLTLSFPQDHMMVGERMQLQVLLQPASVLSSDNVVTVPTNTAEVHCSVSAEGMRVHGPDRAAIPIDARISELAPANFELEAHLRGLRSFTVELFIEDPQSGRLSIFQTVGHVTVESPRPGEERPPLLPALEVRVAPLADFVLEVEADPTDSRFSTHHLTYRLTSRLPFLQLKHQKVGEVVLHETDLAGIKMMIRQAVQWATNIQPEDCYEHMLSMGTYLFDLLFPAESAKDFRDRYWEVADRLTTWLIVEDGIVKDGVTWLPWELVVPYRTGDVASPRFLGERYHLSRWIEGLGSSLDLYNEVPIGEVALAHYKIVERGQEDQDEELLGWRRLLKADPAYGIVQVVKPEIPVFGLHILRHADQATSQDIAPRDGPAIARSPEEEMPRARLNLWFKRPVVTLGILTQADNDLRNADVDDWPLPERARTFLRNGASAVVGPWWPTSEDADRVFWPTFYDLLTRRVPLGEAVWRARLAVWRMLPHRPDWLAYALFGHPRARPYWPQLSEGYMTVECINAEKPLRPGKTYYFRVSIRSRPPTWFQDRLSHVENLPNKASALFLTPGLRATPSRQAEMKPVDTNRTLLQATVGLTASEPGDYPVLVHLLEGQEHLKTLQLTLEVDDKAEGGETSG